jgi:putative peptide zinc metalloprotease protein
MRKMTRWFLTVALASGLGWSGPAVLAQEVEFAGGDNTAVAVNTKDGSSKVKVSFRVVRVKGDVVDQGNVAIAFASCEECRTIAVALQLVLVESDPSVVTPTNLAVAINFECTSCQTLASAYQWVIGTDGKLRLSGEARLAMARIRQELRDLVRSDLAIEEIQAQLDALAEEFEQLIAQELAAAAPRDATVQVVEEEGTGEDGIVHVGQEGGDTFPVDDGATPTPSTSPPMDAGTPTPTAEPTPTASESPSPTVSPTG